MTTTYQLAMPGTVYDACFDPMCTDVPRESGWPTPRTKRVGYGHTMVYEVTAEQRADMIDHAETWSTGLMHGADPDTMAEARKVYEWVRRETTR